VPCLEISLPKTDVETKQSLIGRLTEIGVDAAGFDREVFRIRFHEMGPDEGGTAGKLWNGNTGVPYLHFLLYCPRLKRSVKRRLIEGWSEAFVRIIGQPEWYPVIHICEHPYDDIGASGKVLTEKYPELKTRKFYFDLPDD
jgi:phenylpyruvate tautomerase PptA (4-oxalocrotonate tautomerase family)